MEKQGNTGASDNEVDASNSEKQGDNSDIEVNISNTEKQDDTSDIKVAISNTEKQVGTLKTLPIFSPQNTVVFYFCSSGDEESWGYRGLVSL